MTKPIENKRNLTTKEHASELVEVITKLLDDEKAEDIIIIDLEGKAEFAHYIVVANGRSSRHTSSLADSVATKLKSIGLDNIGVEGKILGDWVLVDAHDVIVHLFRPEIRENYNLERLWSQGFSNEISQEE